MEIPLRAIPKARMTARSKWYRRARRTLEFQRQVAWYLKAQRPPRYDTPVELTARFWFTDRRHGDLKNLVAAIEDALQYAGILPDDRLILRYGEGMGIYYGDKDRIWLRVRPLSEREL